MKNFYASLIFAIAITFGFAASAAGTTKFFLKIDGIDGEVSDKDHEDWIEVESFSVGLHHPEPSWGSTRPGEQAVFLELAAGKALDKASPKLMLACASGNHLSDATLVARKAGSDFSYFEIQLRDVLIASTSVEGTVENERPTESLTMTYSRIEWIYTETLADGSAGGVTRAGWDVLANTEVD